MRTTLHSSRPHNRSFVAAVVAVLALVLSLLTVAPAQALSDTGTGGVFVPASGRVLDTKYNTGGYNTPMSGGAWRTVKIAGNAGIPDDGSVGAVAVTAVILDTTYGQLRGRPNADTATTLMSIYAGGGATSTSNSSIVALNDDGTLQVMTSTDARLVLDVQGYYTSSDDGTAAGGFVPVSGTRIVDTRSGTGLPKAVVASGDTKTIQVTGNAGVPAGASGVVVTMIAVNKEAKIGTLTPFAYGAAQPKNSFQYQESQDTAMSAQVALSSNGKLSINNSGSSTDLVVDVQGYFTAAGKSGAMFTPAAGRAYDTRAGSNTALGTNESRSIQLAGVAGVPVMGSGITAVVITLTAVHSDNSEGRAIVWADGTSRPTVTSMDYVPGSTRSNTVTVPLGANGKISLYNNGTATEYVIDVQGWYTNPQAPTVKCDSPYAGGSWVAAPASTTFKCTIVAAPSDSSNNEIQVYVDGAVTYYSRSDTKSTQLSIQAPSTAGRHLIAATVQAADGSDSRVAYPYGVGDWAAHPVAPYIPNGATTDLTPSLYVVSEEDRIPVDAQIDYVMKAGDGTVVADSGWTQGSWDVPDGVLRPNTSYTWSASIRGISGGRSTATTVQTDTWTLVTNDGTYIEEYDLTSSNSVSTEDTEALVNPDDLQNATFDPNAESASQTSSVSTRSTDHSARSGVLSAAGTKKVLKKNGKFRVSFSTGVVFNKTVTKVTADGESQNWWTGKKIPSKISLADRVTASGLKVTPSVGGGLSFGIDIVDDSIIWETDASKKRNIQHDFDDWSFGGPLTGIKESVSGTVTFGSTSYSKAAGASN